MRVSNRFSAAFEATLDWIELTLASRDARRSRRYESARRAAGVRLGRAASGKPTTTELA